MRTRPQPGRGRRLGFLSVYLCAYLVLAPFDFVQVVPGVSLAKITVLPLAVAALVSVRRLRIKLDSLFLAFFVYFLVALVSLWLTADFDMALVQFASIAQNLLFVLVLSSFDYSEREIRWIPRSLLLGSWIVVLVMVVSPGSVGVTLGSGRLVANLMGQQPDPNQLCEWFVFPAAVYLYRFAKNRGPLDLLASLVFLAAGVFTGSRGGVTGILTAMLVAAACYAYFEKAARRLVLLMPLSAPAFYYVYDFVVNRLPADVIARFALGNPAVYRDEIRFVIWRELWVTYQASPFINQFLGYGPGASVALGGRGKVAHNTLLEHLVDFGFLGLLSYLFLLGVLLRMAWRTRYPPYVASLVGICVVLLSISGVADKPLFIISLLVALTLKASSAAPDGAASPRVEATSEGPDIA